MNSESRLSVAYQYHDFLKVLTVYMNPVYKVINREINRKISPTTTRSILFMVKAKR